MPFWVPILLAAKSYAVDGIVVAVDRNARTMLVSHRPIARYMPAMMMPFRVDSAGDLDGLTPGARVTFELLVGRERAVARRIQKTGDGEIPPPANRLHPGDALPDFTLTSQDGRPFSLADLRGKVAAIQFVYSRCPLPDVCPRLCAAFASLQRRFAGEMDRRLVLLTVTVDPDYDTPPVLAEYAKRWGAGQGWRFFTGNVAPLAAALGEIYWADEGTIGHNSVTTVIGRDGRIAAAVEGSGYRVDQLINLVAHQLETAP